MKSTILNYILLSPIERKRLHIELLPRKVLCSADRISLEGGYNLMLYKSWRDNV